MQSLDGPSEKRQLKDTTLDKAAGENLSAEANAIAVAVFQDMQKNHKDLQKVDSKLYDKIQQFKIDERQNEGERDKMAFASIAFCGPLLLLGMGAAFSIMDQWRKSTEQGLKKQEQKVMQAKVGSKFLHEQPPLAERLMQPEAQMLGLVGLMSLENTNSKKLSQADRKFFDRIGREKFHSLRLSEQTNMARAPLTPEKSWLKTNKLIKKKQKLVDMLEKMRGKESLNTVSALVAKIDLLDKELKKMGC